MNLNLPEFNEYTLAGPQKWMETDLRIEGVDRRSYDPEINFVKDNTIIDGYFEDDKYWGHNLDNIREWLEVGYLDVPDDVCVVGFRGGEFYSDPNLGLPQSYFYDAMSEMQKQTHRPLRYEIHTDDPIKAEEFFPGFEIIHNVGINWSSMRYAKYAVIANSAFYIMPRLLRHRKGPSSYGDAVTIAPRYWARRNIKTWARPACYYKQFTYL